MFKQISLKNVIACCCLCTMVYAPVLTAATYQSHKSIYTTAQLFMSDHVSALYSQKPTVKVGTLDSRLKLKQCSEKLHAFLPNGSREIGRTTVGVKCMGSKPWSLHVPVTVSLYKKVLVSKRQIQKGALLTAADLKLSKQDVSRLTYGYFEAITDGVGMKLKRRMMSGKVLTPAMLKKPQIISRGQKVTILAQAGNMQVRMSGKALTSGAVGDRIKVINNKSQKKLEGVIIQTGEVKVEI